MLNGPQFVGLNVTALVDLSESALANWLGLEDIVLRDVVKLGVDDV